jgi:hypothetical protein
VRQQLPRPEGAPVALSTPVVDLNAYDQLLGSQPADQEVPHAA